jgi:hypothetical protein
VSGTTSSAEPDRLAAYETTVAPVDEALALSTVRFATGIGAFFAGAGSFAPPGSAEEWAAPLLSVRAESSYLATWVTAVGEAFRQAGADPDGDGIYGDVPDDALAPMVGRPVLSEQRAYLAEQLSTLYERAAAGQLDLTSSEMARLLAMARDLVDSSPDPQAEAELLIAAVGPRDVDTAVRLLGSGAGDATDLHHPAVAGLLDLGNVISLGLENQPSRADRWADELVTPRTILGGLSGEQAEAFGVMGAGNAPGTSSFGTALFGALVNSAGRTPLGSLVHRLDGTTDPLAPMMTAAAARRPDGTFAQAPLAHGMVRAMLDADDGASLVRGFGGDVPERYGGVRRDVLAAAVDTSLPAEQRARLSHDLAGHYVEACESEAAAMLDGRFYSPAVTEGFAVAMQPLLEGWQERPAGSIVVGAEALADAGTGGAAGDAGPAGTLELDDGVLWSAVGHLGEAPGGAEGLSTALAGATTARLAAGYAATAELSGAGFQSPDPIDGDHLDQLGAVYRRVVSAVGNARFRSVVDAVESDGGGLEAAAASVAYGIAGEVPGGSTAAGVTEALSILAADGTETTGGGSALRGLASSLSRDLVAFNLMARPDLATDGLVAALREARASGDESALYRLVHDSSAVLSTGGGAALLELQQLVDQQEERIALDLAVGLDEMTRTEAD